MKTIIEQIESRIAEHQRGVAYWKEQINLCQASGSITRLAMLRAQRGHILAAIEELEWCKRTIALQMAEDAQPSDSDVINAAIKQLKQIGFTPSHVRFINPETGQWEEWESKSERKKEFPKRPPEEPQKGLG